MVRAGQKHQAVTRLLEQITVRSPTPMASQISRMERRGAGLEVAVQFVEQQVGLANAAAAALEHHGFDGGWPVWLVFEILVLGTPGVQHDHDVRVLLNGAGFAQIEQLRGAAAFLGLAVELGEEDRNSECEEVLLGSKLKK